MAFNGIRVFDTVLDTRRKKDTVGRNSSDFYKSFCSVSNWGFSHERIHSLSDMKYFLSRKIHEDVIVFSGHGNEDGFSLTNGDVFNPDTAAEDGIKLKPANQGKIIIFASCLIGKNVELCYSFREFFNAKHIFAYKHEVLDKYCFLYESILLSTIDYLWNEKNKAFTLTQFDEYQKNTAFMKNMNMKNVKTHPLVMF
jgi:hypothetical protein